MDDRYGFASPASSLFDTYLIYGIVGLLLCVALIGLIVLLATSCCCCCCSSSISCCFHRRHSSYKLRRESNRSRKVAPQEKSKPAYVRRHPSDVADFSQLYESCPHLINSKAMNTKPALPMHLETSCTTIDTLVSPISPCSSFRSFVGGGLLPTESKTAVVPNETVHILQQPPAVNPVVAPIKSACSRPFSYIKNTNDRTQIQRRFTSNERSSSSATSRPAAVPIDIKRMPSSDSESDQPSNASCTNIYETVVTTTNISPAKDVSIPIYETEWTHNLRQLMLSTSPRDNAGVAVIELPSSPPPDLVSSIHQQPPAMDYFQQQHPHDKFLTSRTRTSDSMRRTNMLRRLKDDAAFLY